tara:strand:+ start:9388 stop:12348 length:2961 start_codon:yes stop_codon:yes gene_type:complete
MRSVVWLLFSSLFLAGLSAQIGSEGEAGASSEYEEMLQAAQRKLLRGEVLAAETTLEELFEFLIEDGVDEDNRYRIGVEVGLNEIALRRGHYEKARDGLRALPKTAREVREVVLLQARVLRRLGDYEVAIALLKKLVANDEGDCHARHQLGAVLHDNGQRQEATKLWQENADRMPRPKDALQLAYVGRSMFRLGGRNNYEAASRLLVDSMKLAPERPEARTTLGELKFLAYGETSGFPSGEKDLKKVLDRNGDDEAALLAMYRIRSANMALDANKTEKFLSRVLDRNPRSVEALLERASNVLDDRRFEEAARRLNEVLSINRNHRVALCHRAAAAMLLHEDAEFREYRERALAGDPDWPECDRIIGDHLGALYRFADAIPFFEAALVRDPEHVPSMHGLARSLIYTGGGKRARLILEEAKKLQAGLVDPWRNNAIAVQDLLEEEYDVVEHGDFTMLLHKDDAEVLRAYLLPIHLEAVEVLGAKYGWQPKVKTTVEVLHTWDDFSVRTIGFRGFTALGACFGRLITLVSPVDMDLRRQDFMWEATAWHEYTHVLTLGVSKNRVPRWLTEGFSVYEERAREKSWERGMERDLFDAYHNQDIPPVHLMNRLFRGPRILFGYYQGGLIVELIAKRYGFDKALELLRGFGDDLPLQKVFDRALGMSSRKFDRIFLEYVEKDLLRGLKLVPRFDNATLARRMTAAKRDPSDMQSRIDLCWAALQRNNPVDAGRWLADVLRTDPEHPQGLLVRAEMLRRRGQLEAAVEMWQRGFKNGADDFDSRIQCGDVMLKLGNEKGAIDQWQRAKACWPSCTEQQTAPELRLAKLYRDQGERTQAQMEMKSYCRRTARAFTPRYTLAEFEKEAGNRRAELQYLIECNRIDPFYREMHVRMGEAYEALGQLPQAALEFEVAAAVLPSVDRAYLTPQAQAPAVDSPEELTTRCELWLRAAKLRHQLKDSERRDKLLQRVIDEDRARDLQAAARDLQQEWRGK